MRARLILLAVALFAAALMEAKADPYLELVQQKLKDQGFYYGETNGAKDAETTAAIRRYQIRNGLQITGELNKETQKSLAVRGGPSAPQTAPRPPVAASTPVPRRSQMPPPDTSDLRDDRPRVEEDEFRGPETFRPSLPATTGGLFSGTPYAGAPPQIQQQVIVGAQTVLTRRGYYRSGIDGAFGQGTEFALRAYQARFGIVQTGRLDTETLASMGLLPGQRAPGLTAPRRRFYRRTAPTYAAPNGEQIYVPRR
ncbi:MAG: peptidoglycan-binding protein [Chthoniobacterales bacterium]